MLTSITIKLKFLIILLSQYSRLALKVIIIMGKYFTRLYSSMRPKDLVNCLKIIGFTGEEILCFTIKEIMAKT
jgi:hypothetical protein